MRVTLSLRGDYAVRAMLALAQHAVSIEGGAEGSGGSTRLLSAARIAERMRIPGRFVAHVLADLRHAGLVIGSTGRSGGYRLALPAERIDLLRIVDAAEPHDGAARCVLRGIPCDPIGRCAVHDAFGSATAALRAELASKTLAGLVARPE